METTILDVNSTVVKLAELYIAERILLGRSKYYAISNYLIKIIDINEFRYSYYWGTLGFNWLIGSLKNSLQLVKEESNNQASYHLGEFSFALNMWALEVFSGFQQFVYRSFEYSQGCYVGAI